MVSRTTTAATPASQAARDGGGLTEDVQWRILLVCSLVFTYFFGRYLPPLTAFLTGPQLYTYVGYVYDEKTVFDNTILTYGTDYILAVTHFYLCWRIMSLPIKRVSLLQSSSAMLVASFAVASLTGAICHQFLWRDLNTWYFRLWWRLCVGSVGAAGGALGLCGSEIAKLPKAKEATMRLPSPPIIPTFFWVAWGAFFFGVIWIGLYSMRNPACDIFLTGVTQSPPTFYVVYILLSRSSWENIVSQDKVIMLAAGLLSNCILLPGYDLLNYLQLPDGVCNVFLHSVLFCAWSAQGISLRAFIKGRDKVLADASKSS